MKGEVQAYKLLEKKWSCRLPTATVYAYAYAYATIGSFASRASSTRYAQLAICLFQRKWDSNVRL